jgi:site-specific DNA-methyltransferase (cytosine-N4-specific)
MLYLKLMGELYTTEDAAKYLGVTPSRIRQFILEDRLDSEKYGRDHLIQKAELIDFEKNGKKKRGRPKKIKNNSCACVRNIVTS